MFSREANGGSRERGGVWSGEATRATGTEETRIDISIGDEAVKPAQERKERPVWMTESTVGEYEAAVSTSDLTSLQIFSLAGMMPLPLPV